MLQFECVCVSGNTYESDTNLTFSGKMEYFSVFDEDDYGDLFITQSNHMEECVSLEENDNCVEFKSVKDPQYSDISDAEEEAREQRLRFIT